MELSLKWQFVLTFDCQTIKKDDTLAVIMKVLITGVNLLTHNINISIIRKYIENHYLIFRMIMDKSGLNYLFSSLNYMPTKSIKSINRLIALGLFYFFSRW